MAFPLPLTDEQRQRIRAAVSKVTVETANARPAELLPSGINVRELSDQITTEIPAMRNLGYVRTADRILLISPPNRIVVGEIPIRRAEVLAIEPLPQLGRSLSPGERVRVRGFEPIERLSPLTPPLSPMGEREQTEPPNDQITSMMLTPRAAPRKSAAPAPSRRPSLSHWRGSPAARGRDRRSRAPRRDRSRS